MRIRWNWVFVVFGKKLYIYIKESLKYILAKINKHGRQTYNRVEDL